MNYCTKTSQKSNIIKVRKENNIVFSLSRIIAMRTHNDFECKKRAKTQNNTINNDFLMV
jgi:hypothetical protein